MSARPGGSLVRRELVTRSPEQTLRLGRLIGEAARGGVVIGLSGALGAGKTQLVKGIARGLGVPADEPVVSPTFVLVREYRGRLRLLHADAYRLADAAELWALGLDEAIAAADSVVVIEWADRFAESLPPGAWWIEAEHAADTGPSARRITLALPGEPGQARLLAAIDREFAPIDRP